MKTMTLNISDVFRIVKKAAIITGVILSSIATLEKLRDVDAYMR